MTDLVLPFDAFIRTIGIHRNSPHALFLGAGASITSGVPSAQMCVWEWKRSIFLTNHPGLEDQFSELSLESVKIRIQDWLDAQGTFPIQNSPDEYSAFIEACYPILDSRRAYFQEKVKAAKPFTGYKLLCLLAEQELIRSVWTTNFDSLTLKSATEFEIVPVEVGIDSQERLPRIPTKGELLYIAMHGDYRYDSLMNTVNELRNQEEHLRQQLINHISNTSFIFSGYKGGDSSIMEALTTGYSQPGTGALYWCGYGAEIPESVKSLICAARDAGRTAYFIPTRGFDDVMSSLVRYCLEGESLKKAQRIISSNLTTNTSHRKPFEIDILPTSILIKSNAFELVCPSEVFAFEPRSWPDKKTWAWLRGITKGHEIVAVPFKRIVCLGVLDNIKDVFGDLIKGAVERVPVDEHDLLFEDGAMNSLMKSALVSSLATRANLNTDRRSLLWEVSPYKQERFENQVFQVLRSVIVFIRRISGRLYLVLKPSVIIADSNEQPAPEEISKILKNKVLSSQYNNKFNEEVKFWTEKFLFAGKSEVIFEYPPNCSSTFRFKVRTTPLIAAMGKLGQSRPVTIAPTIVPMVKQQGVMIDEPSLVFSNKSGSGLVKDIHPIRGLVQARPYDYSLTLQGLVPSISLGIICPKNETRKLQIYLHQSQARHSAPKSMQDHLLDYPGFNTAYGTPLEIPSPGDDGWITCPEPDANLDAKQGSLELARFITKGISQLESTKKPSVIIIFIPDR
jgi:SIR2-like domain